jgi:hypothetical protein
MFMREEGKGKREELMPEADSLRATLGTPPSPCDTPSINRGGVVEALTHPEGMQSTNCPSVYRGTSGV